MVSRNSWFIAVIIGLLFVMSVNADRTSSDNDLNTSSLFRQSAHPQNGYWMTVDNLPLGIHYVGDSFTVSGETNLPAGQEIECGVFSSGFNTGALGNTIPYGTGSTVVVAGRDGINTWSFVIDTTKFVRQTRTGYVQSEAAAGNYFFSVSPYGGDLLPLTLVNKTEPGTENITRIVPPDTPGGPAATPTTAPLPVSMAIPVIATGIAAGAILYRKW